MLRLPLILLIALAFLPPALAEDGDISLRILPSGTFVAKEITGSYSQLGAAYGEVGAFMVKHGLAKSGPAVSVFFDDPKKLPEEKLRSEARIPIDLAGKKPPMGENGVRVITTKPRLVLRTVHYGTLASIGVAFDRLGRAVPGRGIKYVRPAHHVYLTDLQKTPPDRNRVVARLVVEPTGPTDLGIYAGKGTFGPFLIALSRAFEEGEVSFRPITPGQITDGKLAKRCKALLMPGGWAAEYKADLEKDGAKRIQEFVAKGRGYVGICAGAFFAAEKIVWEDVPIEYPLDLFPGLPNGPIERIAPWPKFALTELTIDTKQPIMKGLPTKRTVLYYGGPVLSPGKGKKVTVLARFGESQDAAMVSFRRGKGRVFLSSVHPEICLGTDRDEIGWPAAPVETPDRDRDDELLLRGVRWVLGQ